MCVESLDECMTQSQGLAGWVFDLAVGGLVG